MNWLFVLSIGFLVSADNNVRTKFFGSQQIEHRISQGSTFVPAKAAELRRWENATSCDGNGYSVLSTDIMNECVTFRIPAPASIRVFQTNETDYQSWHYQGDVKCE